MEAKHNFAYIFLQTKIANKERIQFREKPIQEHCWKQYFSYKEFLRCVLTITSQKECGNIS